MFEAINRNHVMKVDLNFFWAGTALVGAIISYSNSNLKEISILNRGTQVNKLTKSYKLKILVSRSRVNHEY